MSEQVDWAWEWLQQVADGSDDNILTEVDALELIKRFHQLEAEVARLQDMCERQLERMIRAGIADNAYTVEFQFKARAGAAEAKLRGANAEIERQQGLVRNYLETIEGNEIDIAGLLEKLRAVGELPRFDIEIDGFQSGIKKTVCADGMYVDADELEALLKDGA